MQYCHRVLEKVLPKYLSFFSVIGITGPRQSGKSTMLINILKDYKYVTFDDFKQVEKFNDDPEYFMRENSNKVIFDEVQKVPKIFDYIKLQVDKDRDNPGKFILTGSSQFIFIKGITESLAGRIGLLSLLPYQLSEIKKDIKTEEIIINGSYPELVTKNYQMVSPWYSAYLETYIAKDVKILANIGNLRDFRRLISLLAANTGQQLNLSRYANDLGVDVKTINNWISVLEASYIIFTVQPFYNNYGKRIVKSPKVYFYDTGLVSYLVALNSVEQFLQGPMYGSLFENYVISEILKREKHNDTNAELFYYRTSSGIEVDLIIDRKNSKEFIEIKAGETFRPKMLNNLLSISSFESNSKSIFLYRGVSSNKHKEIDILNYKDYLIKDDA